MLTWNPVIIVFGGEKVPRTAVRKKHQFGQKKKKKEDKEVEEEEKEKKEKRNPLQSDNILISHLSSST